MPALESLPPQVLRVEPVRSIRGRIRVPGDKSITHRAYLLGALARGTTRVTNPNLGSDCEGTLRAAALLGARVTRDAQAVEIEGTGGVLTEPPAVIDCGNSATSLRLLMGVLAGMPGIGILTGDSSLCERPMDRVIEPLTRMGARIWSRSEGRAPLAVRGGPLRGIEYRLPVASAQVKSAILLAGLAAQGATTVIEAAPTRDHTERMLAAFGAEPRIEENPGGGRAIHLAEGAKLGGVPVDVPGDPSAAAFYLVAALILPDSEVVIERVAMNPTRRGILDTLIEMGGQIEIRGLTEDGFEPQATVVARSSRLRAVELAGSRIAGLIDELPVLAVAAAAAEGSTAVRDAAELRVKESDRIALVCRGLAAAGVRVEEYRDGFVVHGGLRPQAAAVDAGGDHRIAMAMAVLGLAAAGPIEIHGAAGIATSFPDFVAQLPAARAPR